MHHETRAWRRIKEIRKRPRGTTPTDQPNTGAGAGAFSQLSAAPTFSSSSFSVPSNPSIGFSFGQSQSFPGASSAPSQPAQSSSTPFSFGSGSNGTSAGFNFSAGGGFSTPSSNPFAASSFGAANTSTPSTAPVSFGGFGNQASSQSSQPTFSSGLFGAPQNTTSSVGAGVFGQSMAPNTSANPVADSMQTSPDNKPKGPFAATSPSLPSKNLFGSADASSNLFSPKPATQSSNPFGNLSVPSASDKPSGNKAEGDAAKPAPVFGQATAAVTPAQPFGSLFGAASASSTSDPQKATSQPATNNLFAPKTATGNTSSGNLFMSTAATSQPAKADAAPSTTNNIFSPKPSGGIPDGNNLFAPKSTDQSSTSNPFAPKPTSEEAAAASTSQPFGSLFGATGSQPFNSLSTSKAATEQPVVNNIFASKSTSEKGSDNTASSQPFASLFGAASASSKPVASENTHSSSTPQNLFAPKSTADQSASTTSEPSPFKGLFGATSNPPKPVESEKAPSLFAPKPVAEQTTEKPTQEQPFKSLFGSSSPSKPSDPFKVQSSPATAQNLFTPKPVVEQPSATSSNPFSGLLAGKPAAPQLNSVKPSVSSSPQKSLATSEMSKPDSSDNVLSKEVRDEADLLWVVSSLDKQFKKQVLSYEPGIDSFDTLIMFYLKVRNHIGAPVKGSKKFFRSQYATSADKDAEKSVETNGPNGTATSSLFAKSFSSSGSVPPKPTGIVSEPKSSAGENTSAKPAATTTSTPAAPKLAGNMFAQSSQGPTSAPAPAIPKFGNGAAPVDFMAQFKKKAEDTMAEEKAKRKAEDFDSDEDDEAEWERRDAEQQREKRAKVEAGSKKKSVFRNGKFEWVDADESDSAAAAPKPSENPSATTLFPPSQNLAVNAPSPTSSASSIFDSYSRPLPASENIFGRLSATPQPIDDSKESGESDDEDKPTLKRRNLDSNSSDEGDFGSALRNSKPSKPSDNADITKSSLDTPSAAPTPGGRSLFDRIQSPTPPPQKEGAGSLSNLFGSSTAQKEPSSTASSIFGTPTTQKDSSQKEPTTSTSSLFASSFGQSTSTPADNTWKPNTPIKFSADPTPAPTSVLTSTQASSQASNADNATSGEATPDGETAPGAIYDMSQANAGEEEEVVVFEGRGRAFKLATGWASQGTGALRLLRHPETGRARIILRADGNGNLILNSLLKKDFDYARQNNSVQFMVPQSDGKLEHWAVRVNAQTIEQLHSKIQEIKN
ncbi:hypothetical protein N7462_008083 [Penicillium macrosclerotiorum]|uniref:uncharacterized protein n=1 Tax=Penicillium macrosclerotiorum TaxID=303699 RepID=UPI0025488EA4|nr:uncharacterized protein N7462_008083 [Penicillium macrosclerotiorum]KAJ5679839.1 hypothetical protein N7462_008083 [Penicillium macrosclerotiorum]